MKILVLDADPEERSRLLTLLGDLGHQVIPAASAQEGLEAFVSVMPDLVLLDVDMPELGGLETARRLRRLEPLWTPIIFLSGRMTPEDIAAGIEAGGDDYLAKPIHSVVLAAKVMAMQRIVDMTLLMSYVQPPGMRAEIAELAALDQSSGFATHKAGRAMLSREFIRCSRSGQSLSLLIASVDDFSATRQGHGQATAERCAKNLAVALKGNASRMSDFIARHAEDAFFVIMPDTPLSGALNVAERIHSTIADLEESATDGGDLLTVPVPFSISIGIATLVPAQGGEAERLIAAAEEMLARARQDGGSRVEATLAYGEIHLTPRELECLQWSAAGKSSWEIATILGVSESAVNFHMANIRGKFDVGSRRQAVVQAIRYGLIRAT
jgi:diguanylate cyclase (GGDEF)-like protein